MQPKPASLPVGIDFLGLPFSEPKLFEIAAVYESATRHRTPPPDFGPLDTRRKPVRRARRGKPRALPQSRRLRADERRAIDEK